jgi:hypothetical protein
MIIPLKLATVMHITPKPVYTFILQKITLQPYMIAIVNAMFIVRQLMVQIDFTEHMQTEQEQDLQLAVQQATVQKVLSPHFLVVWIVMTK